MVALRICSPEQSRQSRPVRQAAGAAAAAAAALVMRNGQSLIIELALVLLILHSQAGTDGTFRQEIKQTHEDYQPMYMLSFVLN